MLNLNNMYKSFKLHEHDLKFHTTDIQEEKEKRKIQIQATRITILSES
ncbi:MAG: hypothetical protein ACKPKO_31720 [Candidatus Fonsibacter sp.]